MKNIFIVIIIAAIFSSASIGYIVAPKETTTIGIENKFENFSSIVDIEGYTIRERLYVWDTMRIQLIDGWENIHRTYIENYPGLTWWHVKLFGEYLKVFENQLYYDLVKIDEIAGPEYDMSLDWFELALDADRISRDALSLYIQTENKEYYDLYIRFYNESINNGENAWLWMPI